MFVYMAMEHYLTSHWIQQWMSMSPVTAHAGDEVHSALWCIQKKWKRMKKEVKPMVYLGLEGLLACSPTGGLFSREWVCWVQTETLWWAQIAPYHKVWMKEGDPGQCVSLPLRHWAIVVQSVRKESLTCRKKRGGDNSWEVISQHRASYLRLTNST